MLWISNLFHVAYENAHWWLPPVLTVGGAIYVARFSFHRWSTEKDLDRWMEKERSFFNEFRIFSDFIIKSDRLLSSFEVNQDLVSSQDLSRYVDYNLYDLDISQHPFLYSLVSDPETRSSLFIFFRIINSNSLLIHYALDKLIEYIAEENLLTHDLENELNKLSNPESLEANKLRKKIRDAREVRKSRIKSFLSETCSRDDHASMVSDLRFVIHAFEQLSFLNYQQKSGQTVTVDSKKIHNAIVSELSKYKDSL